MSENRKKVTSKEAVLTAILECDQIGTENFREKYGFRESRKYSLVHNGTFYDSKAILAVAHGYQYPDIGPLTPQTPGFSGGKEHAAKELEDLGFEIRSHTKNTVSCWLLNSKVDPVVEQVRTYADEPSSVYEWDSLVPNHSKPKAGDFILIWDSGQLLVFGMSVIQTISSEKTFKVLLRCPECKKTDARPREKLVPRYRCGKCRTEFAEPVREEVRITRFKSDHEAGWQNLSGLLDGRELKTVCFKPESQHSIREIDLAKFEELMSSKSLSFRTESVRDLQREIAGGYKWTRAKTRIGQDLFRKELLEKYGATCAIVGVSHPKTIQACHLYSWSEKGKHDIDGGLLMRSDLHSLFDDGLLRINPDSLKVVLSEELAEYPDYWQFNDQALKVDLSSGQKEWLQIRWEQHS